MVHRSLSYASQPSHMDHTYTWNHQNPNPRMLLGHNSFMPSMDNSATSGVNSMAHNIAPRTNGHPASSFSLEYLNYRAANPLKFQNMHSSPAGSCFRFSPNHAPHMPGYSRPIMGDGCNTVNPQIDNRRVSLKRKSPEMPLVAERPNVGGYYCAGSSSNFPISSDYLQAKPIPVPQYRPLNSTYTGPNYRSDNLLSVGEGPQRNVRSRHSHTFHLEHNPAGAYPSSNMPHHSSSTASMSGPSMAEQGSQTHVSGTPQGRILFSDNGYYNHELNQSLGRSNINNGTAAMNAVYYPNTIRNWSCPLPNLVVPPPQGMVPGQSNYDQRMTLNRTVSSHPLRFAATSSEGGVTLQAEAAVSSRQSRPLPIIGHSGNVRRGRARNLYNTFHSSFNEDNPHDRWVSEGIVMIDQSMFYDPSDLFDRYRDMRLDIDNMSYEELLALEESIGNVSTGLSEDRILACLIKRVHCSNQTHDDQEERSCAICLEEYKDRDNLGSMKCGHDFHIGCIRKWLEIKNVCPVCKASALEDISKEKQICPF
ncbi:probable E3 ubiquitin-protein ligase HIP1 [Phoenix dactylifera]|uniref:RING-type E3 ubiquitin transferase n=1 Tax=Phoenix dactylifera TaxID=42345 RepID=A0A8B9AAJ0_PHODC|nr:probable E3 ubiquitin-protein ligase HIP1 [Phoenix dactylifera]XP_017698913.2 probable E3 ubiquitin-protein ligase HIP1 [Phoenix dactylifera]XP_026661058.2 probable E3 ubiquitin-protein ligase HIP1 [Phoenix dactylifera]XP_038980209.1 probable E3 ubiquitin-protein ligase HIP1 [Phoenix dactylifera]XP_038980210.1 probable E3 ubiquitin-protein ligase HIP1 [Phoenix dactylifera]XP_038980211.1 probable E3 ubiquitin-protein ligase HIP1 [Phoenix dactylifera]XP_038980212.1 probable E3 ubiquitin-prot